MMNEKAIEEPSMDEILASIRQIISEPEKKAGTKSTPLAKDEDILDLTHLLPEEASSHSVFKKKGVSPKPLPVPQKKSPDRPLTHQKRTSGVDVDNDDLMNLLSENRSESVKQINRVSTKSSLSNQTIEDLVTEALNPILKDWLNAHLPQIVREVVGEKVEKIIRQISK